MSGSLATPRSLAQRLETQHSSGLRGRANARNVSLEVTFGAMEGPIRLQNATEQAERQTGDSSVSASTRHGGEPAKLKMQSRLCHLRIGCFT